MSDFDHTPTDPPPPPSDPSVDDLPGEPDEGDIERGSADGSARHNEVLDDSLDRAADSTGAASSADWTTEGEDPSVG